MPSIYAHYRFGTQILPELPADVRAAVSRHRNLFDAGLQGPDFFFFYQPFHKNDISKLGTAFHRQSGREFFSRVCEDLRGGCREEETVYLYGLLGHYCLDAHCHPFVHEMTDDTTMGHNAMESEFDRYLLALDGIKKPHTHNRAALLKLPKDGPAVLARFYPPATGDQIREAMSSAMAFTTLLTCGNPLHRAIAGSVLKGLGPEQMGLILPPSPDAPYVPLNEPLKKRFDEALAHYPELLEQLRDHLIFRDPLGEGFDPIFG